LGAIDLLFPFPFQLVNAHGDRRRMHVERSAVSLEKACSVTLVLSY
jgi:hypothetical protein